MCEAKGEIDLSSYNEEQVEVMEGVVDIMIERDGVLSDFFRNERATIIDAFLYEYNEQKKFESWLNEEEQVLTYRILYVIISMKGGLLYACSKLYSIP